jgi:hypothetical protein
VPFIQNTPRLDGQYYNPGPQRADVAWHRRFLQTLMNRDALALVDTTSNSSSTTTAPLIPNQVFRRSTAVNVPADLTSMRLGTTTNITARNGAAARNSIGNGA